MVLQHRRYPPFDSVLDIVFQLRQALFRLGVGLLSGVKFRRSLEVGANGVGAFLLAPVVKQVLELM